MSRRNWTVLALYPWLWLAVGCNKPVAPAGEGQPQAQSQYPPMVLNGKAALDCRIDAEKPGTQSLVVTEGGGLEFSAKVSPIVDGTVHLEGPDKGGVYRFTSHLMEPAKGRLSGVGDVTVDELETRVTVAVKGYAQPGGPGTPFHFTQEQIDRKGVYVEFLGRLHGATGERSTFRVNLGASEKGSGEVKPRNANYDAPMAAKAVMIEAPITTVVSTTTLQRLP